MTTKSTKTAAKKSTSKTAATRALREKKATPKPPTAAKKPRSRKLTDADGIDGPFEKAMSETPKKASAKKSEPKPAALPPLRAIYNAAMKANVERKALAAELGVEVKAKATNRDLARAIAKAVVASGVLPAALAAAVKPKREKGPAKERGPSVTSHVLDALAHGGTVPEIVAAVVKAAPQAAVGAKLGQEKQLAKHVADVVFRLRRGTLLVAGAKKTVVKKDGKLRLVAA